MFDFFVGFLLKCLNLKGAIIGAIFAILAGILSQNGSIIVVGIPIFGIIGGIIGKIICSIQDSINAFKDAKELKEFTKQQEAEKTNQVNSNDNETFTSLNY